MVQKLPFGVHVKHYAAIEVHRAHKGPRGSHVYVGEGLVIAGEVGEDLTSDIPLCFKEGAPGGNTLTIDSLLGEHPSEVSLRVKQVKVLEGHERGDVLSPNNL